MDIMVCYHSFFGCKTCLLDHLPSLRTLVFEACCFSAVHHFVLSNLDSLQMIQLNRSSCSSCVSIRFESLPKLQSLVLGEYALAEDSDKLSTLVMKNLPSFAHLDAAGFNFRYIKSIVLENNPLLTGDGIHVGRRCFRQVHTLQSSGG
ncbi:hypothetical protein WA538_000455 [Blastocystis sp. DL]